MTVTLSISTEREFYNPGDLVCGSVQLTLDRPTKLSKIYAKVRGVEAVSMCEIRQSASSIVSGSAVQTQQVKHKRVSHKGEHKLFSHSHHVYLFPNMVYTAGTYTYPFTLQLPLDVVVGSVNCHLADGRSGSGSAYSDVNWYVNYSLKVVCVERGFWGKKTRQSQQLVLKEKKFPGPINPCRLVQEVVQSRGMLKKSVKLGREEIAADKQIFEASETIKATSSSAAAGRTVRLVRKMVITAGDMEICDKDVVASATLDSLDNQSTADLKIPADSVPSFSGTLINVSYSVELPGLTQAAFPCSLPVKVLNINQQSFPLTDDRTGLSVLSERRVAIKPAGYTTPSVHSEMQMVIVEQVAAAPVEVAEPQPVEVEAVVDAEVTAEVTETVKLSEVDLPEKTVEVRE